MNAINIRIAGHVARITSEYRISPSLYADFRTEMAADFCVPITDEDIDFSYANDSNYRKIMPIIPRVLRKMAEALNEYDVLLMHGAVIALHGAAFMFTAVSGTGKSTHILKWLDNCPDAIVVNGDKPFIKFSGDGAPPLACGSPWAGKENLYTNTMVPLKSIILMERAEDNRMEQISFAQAFPTLLQQVYRPDDEEKMRKTLRLMQRLNPAVSFWRFQFNNFKDDCFDVAYNALVQGQP